MVKKILHTEKKQMKLDAIIELNESEKPNVELYKWAIHNEPPVTNVPQDIGRAAWWCSEEWDLCLKFHADIWELIEYEIVRGADGSPKTAIGLHFKSPSITDVERYIKKSGFANADSIPISIERRLEK